MKILPDVPRCHVPNCALCFSAMITFAQYLQRCSYDGLSKLVKDVVDLAHKCVANEDAPECSKPLVGSETSLWHFSSLCAAARITLLEDLHPNLTGVPVVTGQRSNYSA